MTDVLEETTGDALSSQHVEARLLDWERRIQELYGLITSWLPAGWTAATTRQVKMHEEVMRASGISGRELPVLDLLEHGQPAAFIQPRGLWIVGANGRLDFRRQASHAMIVDAAENFQPPDWKFVWMNDRIHPLALDEAALRGALAG